MITAQRLMFMAAAATLGVSIGLVGCTAESQEVHANDQAGVIDVDKLVAVMRPTEGNEVSGTVTFTQVDSQVRVQANISGLTPDQEHAIHVHEFGDDRSDDGTSTGGHYNPEGLPHGLPDESERHAGDLGNLEADGDGNASYEIMLDNVTLGSAHNPVIGRAVIIHAEPDDGSQPVGAAGARIASGIIGVANPELADN